MCFIKHLGTTTAKFSLQITCSHLCTVIKTLKGEKKQRVYMTLHKHCELGTSDATLDSFDIYLLNSSWYL